MTSKVSSRVLLAGGGALFALFTLSAVESAQAGPSSSVGLLLSPSSMGQALPPSSIGRTLLPNSVAQVPDSPSANGNRPYIERRTLTAAEQNYVLYFNVSLKMRNMAELDQRLKANEIISPAEMAANYDPTTADYQATINWLTSQGFTVVHPDNSHLAVFATGTVTQIEKAFDVNFAIVESNGAEYASAITAPSVPSTLAPAILSVCHLQPHLRPHPTITAADLQPISQPGQPGGTFTPPQLIHAYQGDALYSSGITGTGQTIAVLSGGVPIATDLTGFWNYCGISDSLRHITFINYPEPPYTYSVQFQDTSVEDTLDVEWASGTAPGANVRVYDGTVYNEDVLQQIYNDATNPTLNLHLNQVSTSYGFYEDDGGDTSGQEESDHQYIALLASAGVTFFCGSGDSSYSDTTDPTANADMFYPGADSYCTCVGGTFLYTDANYNVTAETPWLGTSGGTSFVFGRQYWQNENWLNTSAGTDAPVGSMRLGPDVCAPGGGNDYSGAGSAVIFLTGYVQTVIGTSWSGPTWAGFCALLNQARSNAGGQPFGLLGPYLYPNLAVTSPYCNGNFRDIVPLSGTDPYGYAYTNGNRSVQCTQGFDQVTGIGVPNLTALATTLSTYTPATPEAPTITNQTAAPNSAVVGTPYSYTYTTTAYPPATYKVSAGSLPPGLTLDLLSGTVSGTPTQTGNYTATIDAGNLVGTDATESLNITVTAGAAQLVKSSILVLPRGAVTRR